MQRDLESIQSSGTYEEVRDNGQPALIMRWVVTEKETGLKSRLVCRGFEDSDGDLVTDSPTVDKATSFPLAESHVWLED